MDSYEEDFVIDYNGDVSDETTGREFKKEINTSEHLSNTFISNDEAIARELQAQIDREYNENLKKLERKQNGTSKLNISYEKYRKIENYDRYYKEDYYELDDNRIFNNFNNKEGSVVAKHNVNLNRQRNMKILMNLPPNVQTGDGATYDMEISNKVLNGLKLYSFSEINRENLRCKDKERKLDKICKTCLMGVDQTTIDTVYSMLKGMNPCLQKINRKIGDGQESLIYYGEKIPDKNYYHFNEHPKFDCILKLYRLDDHYYHYYYRSYLEKYIADDYRYKDRYNNTKMNKFNLICLWAEKERDNLLRLRKYILCPEPIMLKNNVLVISFIGRKGRPAKTLDKVKLAKREYYTAYNQIVENMKIMYKKARLVHTDLTEYNILWHKQKCYFIDVSQAVDTSDGSAFEYLKRDCMSILDFFKRRQIYNTMNKEELFKYITDTDYDDRKSLEKLTIDLKYERASKNNDEFLPTLKVKLVGV